MDANIQTISKVLQDAGFSCFLVGGCVRDMVMGLPPKDYDLCTNAKPLDIIHVLERQKIPYHTAGMQYGTIVAVMGSETYEITTFRKEQDYSDGRHPDEVAFTDSLQEDLARRDFTINAMAYDIKSQRLIDVFWSISDINDRILRCVGDADKRIKEDGLRILRALRFAIKYDMQIDESLKIAIHKNIDMLGNISKERITDELKKILTCEKPVAKVFAEFSDVISYIIPEIAPCIGFDQNNKWHKHNVYEHILAVVDNCKTNKFEIKLTALLHDIGKPSVCILGEDGQNHFHGHAAESVKISEEVFQNDLVLTNKEKELVLMLIQDHDAQLIGMEKAVKRFVYSHNTGNINGFDFIDDWMILRQADREDHVYPNMKDKHFATDLSAIRIIKDYLIKQENCLSVKDLAVSGNDLMEFLNIPPSPLIGKLLNDLLDAVLDEKLPNEKEALLQNDIVASYDIKKEEQDIEFD